MKRLLLFLIFTLLVSVHPLSAAEQADTVFKNGNIYTVSAKRPRAQAIAIKNGRILFVGSDADAKQYEGKSTRVVDLRGATVVPGMTDAHCHLAGIGEREMNLNLEGTQSLAEMLAKVRTRVDQTKPGEWVV
jgi:predicted amidohydrolase YtcJ